MSCLWKLIAKDLFRFQFEDKKKSLVKFVIFSKDCGQNGDRMSKNDEKLPYLHEVTKKYETLSSILF